ncbi:MAG: response regulator transcription factor [Spirochaetota bacterium]|jgi:two-component system response regulator YesN|uniref:response regulator n=1 Tax=Rectinema subterraneum TaxID=2653714 RepID=UPI00131D110D|nr:response regulator [Rectinema subterraneum]
MKRVLVVDDEMPIVNGLLLLFKRYFQTEYTVVGVAQSGREAIEKAKELAPDIILMDVQMPGITGLDAIRELSRQKSATAFILVTAYERFDIAREALSMGVCDYLLKPVSRERLEIALRVASDYLDRSRLFDKRELEFRDRQQRLVPLIRTAFFCSVRWQQELRKNLGLVKEMLKINEDAGVLGIASFSPMDGNAGALYERFCSLIQYKTVVLVGPLEDNRYCAWFLPMKKAVLESESIAASEISAFLEILRGAFSSELATGEIVLAHGQPEILENLERSWSAAVQVFAGSTLIPKKGSDIAGISAAVGSAIVQPQVNLEIQLSEWEKNHASCALDAQFSEEIMEGQYAMAGQSLEKMLMQIECSHTAARDSLFRIIAALSFAALKLAGGGILSEQVYREFMDFSDIEQLWNQAACHLFAAKVRERFASLQKYAVAAGSHSPFVVRAIQYIENHYQEPITLESAAEAIGISAGHLTRLMSDELKKGFARTLIDYRLQKAKEMLKKPNVSVRDVSRLCGYSDANYFARLFRRMTGVSPSEYSARKSGGEESDA